MKNVYRIRQFLRVCLVLCPVLLASCNKDDDGGVSSGQVELLSFGPSGVRHGEEIQFIGRNLNQVQSIKLPGATVEKSQFTRQTPELITLVVPTETTRGRVALTTATGEIVSKTILDLEVPVAVASVTAAAKPGTDIKITGNYLNWVQGVVFGVDPDTVKTFVSQSMTELVLTVPMDARTGNLTIVTGGTEPLAITTEAPLTVSLPVATGLSPVPVARGANLTITGTDLDLTQGVMFKGVTDTVTEFVSKSPTELVVKVPAEAGKGTVTLVTYSGEEVESAQAIQIVGDLPPLAALPYAIFDDARHSDWGDWGWGGASEWNSTEKVRQGTYAAKKTFDGSYDAIRMHGNTAVATSGYTELTFSVFGTPGTGGKTMNVVINEGWGTPYTFPVVEGEWTTYNLKLTDLGSPAAISDVLFQSAGWAGAVYFDHIGLK